jgi:hypothetical protein
MGLARLLWNIHTVIQDYKFYLVGAASSREYRIGIEQPQFIAAGSRSHIAVDTHLKTIGSL